VGGGLAENYPVPWKFLHDEKIRIRRIKITKIVENNFLKYVSKVRFRKKSFWLL